MATNLINRCRKAEPVQKNMITTAIRILNNSDEIKKFYQECVDLISEISDEEIKRITGLVNKVCELRELPRLPKKINSRKIASYLISYVVSACGSQTKQDWKQAIPELIYPVPHAWKYLSNHIVLDDNYGFRKP